MPITKKEFKTGRLISPEERAIDELLRGSPDKAYTLQEIIEAIGYVLGENFIQDLLTNFRIIGVLNTMVEKGTVVNRQIDLQTYYKIKDK